MARPVRAIKRESSVAVLAEQTNAMLVPERFLVKQKAGGGDGGDCPVIFQWKALGEVGGWVGGRHMRV